MYNFNMSTYRRIRDLREDNDLTVREFASILHMQKTTYHNYEIGKREIPLNIAIMIADYYGVSLDYLCEREIKDKK